MDIPSIVANKLEIDGPVIYQDLDILIEGLKKICCDKNRITGFEDSVFRSSI